MAPSPKCPLYWLQNDKSRLLRGWWDRSAKHQQRLFWNETTVLEIFFANNSFWTELFTSVGHVLSYACAVLWHMYFSARVRHREKVTTVKSCLKASNYHHSLHQLQAKEKRNSEILVLFYRKAVLNFKSLWVWQTSTLQSWNCKCLSGTGWVLKLICSRNCQGLCKTDGWLIPWNSRKDSH